MSPSTSHCKKATRGCPCGYHGDPRHLCRCTPQQTARYLGRLSGPLRDRLDLIVEVQAVPVRALTDAVPGESSASVRERVLTARERQLARNIGRQGVPLLNMGLSGRDLKTHSALDASGRRLLERSAERLNLSARGFHRVLRVSRTIADLAASDRVSTDHLAEALQYRFVEAELPS